MNTAITPQSDPRKPLIYIGVAGALVVIVALVIAITSGSSSKTPGAGAAPFVATEAAANGTPLAPYDEAAAVDPAVGQVAPTLSGQDFDGQELIIGGDKRAKVLVFLAHWCPHCQREAPLLVSWLAAHPQTQVDLATVTTGIDPNRPNYPPSDWLRREKWPTPVLVDGNSAAANAMGLTSFPYFVVVGANGQVMKRGSGELTDDQIGALFAAAATPTVAK